jgi:putative FmdB family regulatory protein
VPIYEFLCHQCNVRFSVLVRNWAESADTRCPGCGGDVERVMSTFAYHRSIKDIQEEAGEPALLSRPDFYKDPRNVGRWTEKKFKEMGLDVPTEIKEEIKAAREGELPDSLKEML